MKTKYPSMFGLLAVLMLVASFVVPANVANPAPVQADPDILRWSILNTPQSLPGLWKEVVMPSEWAKIEVASDGATIYSIVNLPAVIAAAPAPGGFGMPLQWPSAGNGGYLIQTDTGGWMWNPLACLNLFAAGAFGPVWDVAVAPDDPNLLAVVTSDAATGRYPSQVWVSDDHGTSWDSTFIENMITAPTGAGVDNYISCIDISPDYGGRRDLAVGVRDGRGWGTQKVWSIRIPGFGNWLDQSSAAAGQGNPTADWVHGDVLDMKFSPTYVGDATMAIVCSANDTTTAPTGQSGCFWNTGIRDLDQNTTVWGTPVWISDPSTASAFSANCTLVVDADLELPSDFSGQAASLRRAYISIDDGGGLTTAAVPTITPAGINYTTESGIYRIDDTTIYELMDTTGATFNGTRISDIAYYGTYASGKLLAGVVMGDPCWATVPTWFTDSPTTCPIPCWYPAKKPTTGAAGMLNCGTTANGTGWGNAQVAWSPDGATAYAATGSNHPGPFALANTGAFVTTTWPEGLRNLLTRDESAFALSRNNGETWNQLAIIDTEINKLTDVAPSADCTTVYLASSNNGTAGWLGCDGFESVWRTSSNPAVASPLPPIPVGNVWERVLCRPSATICNVAQSDYAILRLAPDKEDGQIVFWAAGGAGGGGNVNISGFVAGANTQAVAWSPDYGDYWANINPRIAVQDMSAESSTTLYILAANGLVQRLPYTGTAWSSAVQNGNSLTTLAHTIDTMAEGNVIVGSQTGVAFAASYSADAAATFTPTAMSILPAGVTNKHVEFDTNFADTGIFFLADDAVNLLGGVPAGTIYRNTIPFGDFENMLAARPFYCQTGYFGLAVAYTGEALYGANNGTPTVNAGGAPGWCTVERTIYRYWPIPKPNIPWDHLDVGRDGYVGLQPQFTLEPSSLKFCGCLTLDTDTELFAIDNDEYRNTARTTGMLWAYTDCLAKVGPALVTEDGLLVGCDPVSGRNQEINLAWEQLCLALGYDVEIAKDEGFTMLVCDYTNTFDQATMVPPANVLIPGRPDVPVWIVPVNAAAGAWLPMVRPGMFTQLECGHKYYWRAKVRTDAWGGSLRSPWSEVRSFTIKAGLPVTTPYYGPQLLSPNNGCIGCPVSPASFSWSPFKGTTTYKFVLATDAAMTSIVAEDTVPTTAYEYAGTLDYSTNYFWRVMSVEPAPSDWSATFSFQTGAAPAAPPAEEEAPPTPMWVWVVIALGAILVIVTLVLIFKTRRV